MKDEDDIDQGHLISSGMSGSSSISTGRLGQTILCEKTDGNDEPRNAVTLAGSKACQEQW